MAESERMKSSCSAQQSYHKVIWLIQRVKYFWKNIKTKNLLYIFGMCIWLRKLNVFNYCDGEARRDRQEGLAKHIQIQFGCFSVQPTDSQQQQQQHPHFFKFIGWILWRAKPFDFLSQVQERWCHKQRNSNGRTAVRFGALQRRPMLSQALCVSRRTSKCM